MHSSGSMPMIFVVGNSRSGTTMMGRILNNHSSIYTFKHEIHFFGQIYEPKPGKVSRSEALTYLAKLIRIKEKGYFSKEDLTQFYPGAESILKSFTPAQDYHPFELYSVYLLTVTTAAGKKIPCDQTPRNLFYLKEILQNYPEARIINMIRDPRGVLLSQKNKWKRRFLGARNIPYFEALRSWSNYHVVTISKLWNSSIAALKNVKDDPRVYSVQYETVLNQPEVEVGNICSFLGITYEPEMIQIPVIGSSARQDLNKTGIDNSRVDSWQQEHGLSTAEIYLCEKITGPVMQPLGYDFSFPKSSILSRGYQYFTLPFKLSFSLLLNLGRSKNILATIKRRVFSHQA